MRVGTKCHKNKINCLTQPEFGRLPAEGGGGASPYPRSKHSVNLETVRFYFNPRYSDTVVTGRELPYAEKKTYRLFRQMVFVHEHMICAPAVV